MNLIIDATNIKSGGGLTHIREILSYDYAIYYGYEQIEIFAPQKTLDKLPNPHWLKKSTHKWLNKNYLFLALWKIFIFNTYIKKKRSLIFIPGTGFSPKPYVTMCRNLLPLEHSEINRFFFSIEWLRLLVLRSLHLYSYKKAFTIIFLNTYCKNIVERELKNNSIKKFSIIPHGLNKNYFKNFIKSEFITPSYNNPFKLIYVSTINLYKHQWFLVRAIDELNQNGFYIELTLVGDSQPDAMKLLNAELSLLKSPQYIKYLGQVEYNELQKYYRESDVFIFSSSCETFGMVILEAMACGLPILCSNFSSMPSTFENVPIYFDPFNDKSIKDAIIKVYNNPTLQNLLSNKSIDLTNKFSWEITSNKTFEYLSKISNELKTKSEII
jgi:glycosyltransferase involved in cell wall biosynthesis